MATYKDWRRLFHEKGELKRAYYVYGSERALVEEIVDATRERVNALDVDYVATSARQTKPRELWAMLNQYPIDPDHRRLVLIRDAEQIRQWAPLEPWLTSRHIPQVVGLFVSNETRSRRPGEERPPPGVADTSQPHLQRFAQTGRLICCSRLPREDAVEHVTRLGRIETGTATRLLERVGWNLAAARNCMAKLALFDAEVTDRMVERLTEPSPTQSFADELIAMRKPRALEALRGMDPSEYSWAVGLLAHRLEQLGRVHAAKARGMSSREMSRRLDIKGFAMEGLEASAQHYDRRRTLECVRTLALIDSRLQRHETGGVMEALVAAW